MKIKKVERQTKKGIDQLEVTYEVEGEQKVLVIPNAEEALKEEDGEPKFMESVRKIEKKKKEDKENKMKKSRIKKFEGEEA